MYHKTVMALSLTMTIAALALSSVDIPRGYDQEEANKIVQWYRAQDACKQTLLTTWTHFIEFKEKPDEAKLKEWFRLQFLKEEAFVRAYESRRGKNNKRIHDQHVKEAMALYRAYCDPRTFETQSPGTNGRKVWQVQYS